MRVLLVLALLVHVAHADKRASLAHYEAGRRAYAAGDFEAAIGGFERAYAEWRTPEYLHDIAQAYRRLDRCDDAATHLERFLAAKPDAVNRAAVIAQLEVLRARCPAAAVPSPSPPVPPGTTSSVVEPPVPRRQIVAPDTVPASTGIARAAPRSRAPSPWHPAMRAGIVMLDAGPVVMPVIGDLAIGVLRDLPAPLLLQLGANISLSRMPYDDLMRGTMWLAGPELVASGRVPIMRGLFVTAGVAAGAQLVTGLDEGNPFTTEGEARSAFVTVRLRGELGAAWRASDHVTLHLVPVGYHYSPRRTPLSSDIPALHGFAMHAGVSLDL